MLLMISQLNRYWTSLFKPVRWIANDHPSSVLLLCAAKQRKGVVPAPQTCKQILFASATTEC